MISSERLFHAFEGPDNSELVTSLTASLEISLPLQHGSCTDRASALMTGTGNDISRNVDKATLIGQKTDPTKERRIILSNVYQRGKTSQT